jgi:hypothetical protein
MSLKSITDETVISLCVVLRDMNLTAATFCYIRIGLQLCIVFIVGMSDQVTFIQYSCTFHSVSNRIM